MLATVLLTCAAQGVALTDLDGGEHAIPGDAPATVLAWTAVGCPMSKVYLPRVLEIEEQFRGEGVRFFLVDSSSQDTPLELRRAAAAAGVPFPVCLDAGGAVARQLEVSRTTEVLVLDGSGAIRYRGAVDDQYGYRAGETRRLGTWRREQPERRFLVSALKAVLAGHEVGVAETDPLGCALHLMDARAEAGAVADTQAAPVTFHEHVEPLLQRRCQECHHDKGIAPFPLLEYEDVEGWAAMILETVELRRMPPWHADPKHGAFRNNPSLSDDEIALVRDWLEADCPRGDPAAAPEPLEWIDDWAYGEPDLIITLPSYEVPAQGRLSYRYVTMPTGLTEDRWVRAYQVRSNAEEVVHHVLTFLKRNWDEPRSPNAPWEPDFDPRRLFRKIPRERRQEVAMRMQRYTYDFVQSGYTGGGIDGYFIAPQSGERPMHLAEGEARFLPANTDLIFQVHYTPNGTRHDEVVELALWFADEPPERPVSASAISDIGFEIPPGDPEFVVETDYRMPRGMEVRSLRPHMHVRGKAATFVAEYPDGTSETLLHVPAYDFDWQEEYVFETPKRMPKGTRLVFRAIFDNSEENPYNPDPFQTVYFGLQSEEEMVIGYFEGVWDQEP